MSKPSEYQRTAFRRALQRKGVPAVYAHMAADALTSQFSVSDLKWRRADSLLSGGFAWFETEQGHNFWYGIALEASA